MREEIKRRDRLHSSLVSCVISFSFKPIPAMDVKCIGCGRSFAAGMRGLQAHRRNCQKVKTKLVDIMVKRKYEKDMGASSSELKQACQQGRDIGEEREMGSFSNDNEAVSHS